MKYVSKYTTMFTCTHCGAENKMPCNFCGECGVKLFKDKCLHCWRNSKKITLSTATSCEECNVNKFNAKGLYK